MNLSVAKSALPQLFANTRSIYWLQPLFNMCFYGIKAVFVLYVIRQFSLNDGEAVSLYAACMSLCYATSLIGGYIGDHWLGVKNTVVLGGMLTALGLLCLLSDSMEMCFLSLALVALGSGCFKPNLLTAVGLTFQDPKDPGKDKAYSFIYVAGNVGILLFIPICGAFENFGKHGLQYSIALIAAIFALSSWVFYKAVRFHPAYREKIVPRYPILFWAVPSVIAALYILLKHQESFHGMAMLMAAGIVAYFGNLLYKSSGQERKDIFSIILYIFLFSLFCALFEQGGSSITLFFKKLVNREILGFVFPAADLLALEALSVLVAGTALFFLSRYWEARNPINGFTKIGCGFLMVALGFWVLAWSIPLDNASLVPFGWIAVFLFVQALGQLWIAPITMSKVSQQSPARLRSIMMGFWPTAIACGHYAAGYLAQFAVAPTPEGSFEQYRSFFFYVGFLPLAIGILVLLGRGVKTRLAPPQESA